MAIAYNPKIVTDNLVLCLDAFNKKGSLSNTFDLSGNGNNGTLTNGAFRNISGSIAFDGNGDAITTPSTTNLNLSAVNNFTIEGWFRCNTLKDGNTVLSLGTAMTSLYWVMAVGRTSGELFFGTGSGTWSWTQQQITSGAGVVAGIWTHVAIVRNGTTLTIYKDGVSIYSNSSWNFGSGQGGTLHIGTYFNNANNDGSWFDGAIYNLRIISGTSLYTSNFTPTALYTNVSGTILWVGRSGIRDESENSRTLTTAGNAVAISADNFSFDGTNDFSTMTPTPTILQGNPDLTIMGFYYRTGNFSNKGFWGIGGSNSGGVAQGICNWNSNNTNEIAIDSWGQSTFTTGQTYPLNTWIGVAWRKVNGPMTRANCTISIFNGSMTNYTGTGLTVLRAEAGTNLAINSIGGLTLGCISVDTGYCAPVSISNHCIYNRVLSDAEVLQNFNATRGRYGI